ncbi:ribosome recycling factor domain-containing protein [Powellomyces hirtus]|nr:ribosome recycling factor domain-containing protein [Powellomyces hirtus]
MIRALAIRQPLPRLSGPQPLRRPFSLLTQLTTRTLCQPCTLRQPALATQQRMYAKKKGKGADLKKGGKKATAVQEDEEDEEHEDDDAEEFDMGVYEEDMKTEVTRFRTELDAFRIGRVNPALLESVVVSHKGNRVPLSRLAQINIKDAQTLMVIMNEEEHTSMVDKAIRQADLGLNPQPHASGVLRVPIPKLTAEYKSALSKKAIQDAEKARNRIRGVRANARTHMKKGPRMPADTSRRIEKDLDSLTKNIIKDVDTALAAKQKDIEKA